MIILYLQEYFRIACVYQLYMFNKCSLGGQTHVFKIPDHFFFYLLVFFDPFA